ncbi:TIM barrel protein [Yaniella flava]|uniref:TIM barrel protein n=1 Tax=Yaniella flava TaxID=287930 RepID=A0ABN2UQJ0_9MICC
MNRTTQPLGLAQLSLLDVAAPQLIRLAADVGFDFIGARVRAVTGNEPVYDFQPGSPLLAETLAAIDETGVTVGDIEFLLVDGSDQRDAWLAMMEAGQALGAKTMTVAASLENEAQLTDLLAQMTEDGRQFGIMPTLEAISYQAVNTLPQAARIARAAGCQLVADTLHLSRVATPTEQLTEYAELIPMLQLCDGPAKVPADRDGLVLESRSQRGVPGDGEFGLSHYVAALPAETPLSVEAPADATVARIGHTAWAETLKAGLDRVIGDATALREAVGQ